MVTDGSVGENNGDVLSVTIIVVVVVVGAAGVVVVLELVTVDDVVVVASESLASLTSSTSSSAGGVITLADVVVSTLSGNTIVGRKAVSLVSVLPVGVSLSVADVDSGIRVVVSISSSVVGTLVGTGVVVVVMMVVVVGVVGVVLVIGVAAVVVTVVLSLLAGCDVVIVVGGLVLAVVVVVVVDGSEVDDEDVEVDDGGGATDAVDGDGFGVGRAAVVPVGTCVDVSTGWSNMKWIIEEKLILSKTNLNRTCHSRWISQRVDLSI